MTRLVLELEQRRVEEQPGCSEEFCRTIDEILDRVKHAAEVCDIDLEEEDGDDDEVVGDIDELLGGLSLEATGPPQSVKQIHLRPGRRYKKVVRKNPGKGNAAIVPAQLGDAGSDAEDHVPEGHTQDVAVSSEDEERRRYGEQTVNNKASLKVEIPVSREVLVQAAAACGREGQMSPPTSGSTKACGIPLTSTTDEYDSDGSITSPAVLVESSFTNPRR